MALEGKQKIAALLLNLDRNAAAQVLKNFSEDEIIAIGQAMKAISGKDIPAEELIRIYEEFGMAMKERSWIFRPRGEDVENLFAASLGPEKSEPIINELMKLQKSGSVFTRLKTYPNEVLSNALKEEHPQTIALVLSNIESGKAAKVITELDEDKRLDILTRIAKMKNPPDEILKNIAEKINEKAALAMTQDNPEEARGRLRTVADVLNQVDKDTGNNVLTKISEDDSEMAEEIKDLMFTFDDLLLVDKRAMQKLLSGINVQVLAMGLKGAKSEVEEFILGNISKRVQKLILEEKELMGPKSQEEVTAAQKEIVAVVRALMESGEITINRSTEEELLA